MSQVNSIANLFLGNMTSPFSDTKVNATSKQNSIDTFSQKLTEAKQTTKTYNNKTDDKEIKSDTTKKQEKETSTENKEIKTKKTQKDNTTQNTDSKVEETAEEELNEVVNEQILVIMSEILELPIEEIEMQLDEMNLQATDLLTEEGFGTWASQMISGETDNVLLNEEIDMTQIRNLFESLETFKEDLGEEIVLQVTDMQNQVETTEETAILSETLKETMPKEVKSHGEENRVTEETVNELLENNETVSTPDLGLTVPIQNFTTTTTTYSFETDTGTITQTVTTKVTPNGQTFIEQVDFKTLGQTRELNIALSPRELGQMNIKIVEQHGVMVAEIKVEHEKAKEFILNEIESLKENLEAQGLNVTEVKVDIRQNDRETQMQQERQKSSKRIAQLLANQSTEDEEIDDYFENRSILSDSKVDYIV